MLLQNCNWIQKLLCMLIASKKKKAAEILTCDKSEIHFLVKCIWVWNVDLCDDKREEISLYVDAWLMLLSKSNYQCFFMSVFYSWF